MIGASALGSPGHGLFLKRCLLASERSIFKKYLLFAVVLRAFMLRRPRPPTQHHPHTDLPNHMAEAPLTSTEMLKSPASPKAGNHCTRAKSKILKKGVVGIPLALWSPLWSLVRVTLGLCTSQLIVFNRKAQTSTTIKLYRTSPNLSF